MRSRPTAIAVGLGLALTAFWGPASARAETPPPNVIIFLVDDLGWMDTGAFGSQYYETPNIDRLAGAGMLFTDAYAASPHCSPTRASILTGRHPARLGITAAAGAMLPLPADAPRFAESAAPTLRWVTPRSRRFLPPEEVTIAEVLRERGYRTAHIGKWHLGQLPSHWPDKQGFEVVVHGAPDSGPPSYFSPYGFAKGNLGDGPEGEYITDRLTDEALEFIESSGDRPFFLHLSHFAVHGPWGYKEELRERFQGRADPRGRQGNSAMAAMIRSVDESLGRIVDRLAELELTRRTMILFTSDNGGAMHTPMGPDDLLPTDNAPLRGAKGLLLEGGVRVPLLVSWPGVVAPGSRNGDPVSSVDFFPTILEAAGADAPPGRAVDGRSLMPLLRQASGWPRRPVFNHFALYAQRAPGGLSVRFGRWKLIRWFQQTPWFPDRLDLYDLEADVGETTNLAARLPWLARHLDALIDGFVADVGVLLPRPNPDFNPRAAALFGWQRHRAEVELRDGLIRCRLAGLPPRWAGLQMNFLKHRGEHGQTGTYRLELRARAEDDMPGRIVLSYPPSASISDRVEAIELAGGGAWQRISARLEVESSPVWIRLEFRGGLADVELDTIRIDELSGHGSWPAFARRLEWRFDLAG